MVRSNKVIHRFAEALGIEPGSVEWFWRGLREEGLVPAGKRGPGGGDAEVGALEASRLMVAYLSGEGARNAREAVQRIGQFCRVGEDIGFTGTFEERLCDIMGSINRRLELTATLGNSGPIVASIAVVRNAAGTEWAEVSYFINSSTSRYSGGLHECNMREVYADPATALKVDDVRAAATYTKECRLHGSMLLLMRDLIDVDGSSDMATD